MKAVVRTAVLVVLAMVVAQCAGTGTGLQGCPQIPEKSVGPCRVGLGPGWYYNESWRDQ